MTSQAALADPSAGAVPARPWWASALIAVYCLAGVTGITYEVLWVRMLGLQFGVSIFGVIVTVAAFMAGLGAGSLGGAALAPHLRRPLRLFGLLEAAVAVIALAMPALFRGIDHLLSDVGAGSALWQWYALQALTAFAVLFIPAALLGMGFSLVLRGLAGAGVNLAGIYGINTLGGAAGALLPLVLLPPLGWSAALYGAVMLGFTVAAAALVLAVFVIPPVVTEPLRITVGRRPPSSQLILYAGIGAAALMLEVGWTRLYGMIFLRTEYVLAVILCVFLIGMGVGSLAVRGRTRTGWLSALPALAAVCVIAGLWLFPLAAGWSDRHQDYPSLSAALWRQGAMIMALTLPVTMLLGAWLPLLGNRDGTGGHGAGAWLYGANSAGAAAGALVGGFLLIPWLGTPGTLILAALMLLGCGAVLAGAKRMMLALPLLLVAAWPVRSLPPVERLQPATLPGAHDLAVYEDALAITHVVAQRDGQRLLLADLRRMDASSDPTAVVAQQDQARLPMLLHGAPHTVLFLGLGTGVSAAGALAFPPASLTAVEVSSGAIRAARDWFAPVNNGVMDRIAVVRDDARRFLRAGDARYDVIIGDLFHPDLVGRGNLLSVQQFARARARLAPGGLFVQWLALNQFDLPSLRIVLRSFAEIFPDGRLFMDGFRLALVGPRDHWLAAAATIDEVADRPVPQREAMTGGEGAWTWLGRYWGRIGADAGPIEDEWRPKIEFLLPRARYNGGVDLGGVLDYLLARRPSLEQAEAELRLRGDEIASFEPAYMAAELAVRGWAAGLQGGAMAGVESERLLRAAYEANPKDRWIGFTLADRMLASLPQAVAAGRDRRSALLAVLAVRPDHVGALKALWRLETEAGNGERAARYRARVRTLSPLDRETSGEGVSAVAQ